LDLIEKTTERLSEPSLEIQGAIGLDDVPSFEYRKIKLTGKFDDKDEMILGPRSKGEGEVGYFLYTPFTTTSGQRLIVNRGFIPLELKESKTRLKTYSRELTNLEGLIKTTETSPFGGAMTSNTPETNSWGWVDLAAMAGWTHSDPILIDLLLGKHTSLYN
jgi:surfeit locus 1 family protein